VHAIESDQLSERLNLPVGEIIFKDCLDVSFCSTS